MTIKHSIRQLALRAGIEVRRDKASESPAAHIDRQLSLNQIDAVMDYLRFQGFELRDVSPGFVDPRSGRMLNFDGTFYRN